MPETASGVRPLTQAEGVLTRSMFGDAIDTDRVTVRLTKWFPFQPREVVMAPCGHLHFHPRTSLYRDDFDAADVGSQGLFLHEMTHVWQTQTRGRFYLPLMRHPFCRYRYSFEPGKPFAHYGLEQQGELVRHAFLLGRGARIPGAPPLDALRRILPFGA